MFKNNKGFTLIEVVVSIAISSIILVTVGAALPYVFKMNYKANNISQAQILAQTVINKIENDIRYADSLTIESGSPLSPQANTLYIYDNAGGKIQRRNTSGSIEDMSPEFPDLFTYGISFTNVNGKIVCVTVKVYFKTEMIYTMDSNILVNNLGPDNITGLATGACARYTLTVRNRVLVTGISISSATNIVAVGSTMQLTVSTVTPSDATYTKVAWSVDDTSVATISKDGLLTAINSGTVFATARAVDGSAVTSNPIQIFVN